MNFKATAVPVQQCDVTTPAGEDLRKRQDRKGDPCDGTGSLQAMLVAMPIQRRKLEEPGETSKTAT